jgi:hypothetical protein
MNGRTNLLLIVLLAVCALSFWRAGQDEEPGERPERGGGDGAEVAGAPVAGSLGADRAGGERADPGAAAERPVHLLVLNGTAIDGLAHEIGMAVSLAGCVVERVSNAPHDRFARSLLVNRRLTPNRVARLAERLGGLPVLEERDPRTTEDAVLVLGADHERIRQALKASRR